jgi:hypothetical protein
MIDRVNGNDRRKPAPVTLCPPKMLNDFNQKNGVFWDVTLCGSFKNEVSGGT